MSLTDGKPADVLARERRSFGYAFAGIGHAWRTQAHLRIQVGLGLLALVLAWALALTPPEWAVVLATITLVLVLELLNTAVEAAVDLASPDHHPLARVAKDVTAGAVLVASIGAILVAVALFVPRLLALAR
ncbi:MAG TPA: diacylglycerol kinase family protein [Chloroflexota bacterium]|jgi:diacylglycerol kinase